MIRRPPRSTPLYSSAASDVYKRQLKAYLAHYPSGKTSAGHHATRIAPPTTTTTVAYQAPKALSRGESECLWDLVPSPAAGLAASIQTKYVAASLTPSSWQPSDRDEVSQRVFLSTTKPNAGRICLSLSAQISPGWINSRLQSSNISMTTIDLDVWLADPNMSITVIVCVFILPKA